MNNGSFLNLALKSARESLDRGDYPVGAVLVINGEVYCENNSGETSKNYSNHAETKLIMSHGKELLEANKNNSDTVLYSTLEPCLMCLGVAVMNKVKKIVYMQNDPLAGACSLDRMSMGDRYKNVWPEIIYEYISSESKEMILEFLNNQIKSGIRIDWSRNFLGLIERTE